MPSPQGSGFPPCKQNEVCRLPGPYAYQNEQYCILHLPDRSKDQREFKEALVARLAVGDADLRYLCFPNQPENPNFANQNFSGIADFRFTTYGGTLNLSGSQFDRDVLLGGPLTGTCDLSAATIAGSLSVESSSAGVMSLFLVGTAINGMTSVAARAPVHIRARLSRFGQRVQLTAPEFGELDFSHAELQHGLILRGRVRNPGLRFENVKCGSIVDLRDCQYDGNVVISEATCEADVTLDLSGSRVRGDVIVEGSLALPRIIVVDGLAVTGKLDIQAEVGTQRPEVIATVRPVRFGGTAQLQNVDVSKCLLTGNWLGRLEFSDVMWARRLGRSILYDEIALRKKADISITSLKENYQILKEKYREKGDHVTSGDFHYGEMEMRRRERGSIRRVLSVEFTYWLLSGYGTRHIRAGVFLAVIAIGFALAYLWSNPALFTSAWDTLHFSVSVMTLQRPSPPSAMTATGRWLQLIESVIGPVQLALFALALRMRLRR